MLWKYLGGEEGMGYKCNTITLYTSQAQPVLDILNKEGVCYSKREYVLKKYQESASIFTTVYDFYAKEAEKYVAKPEYGEYPYWAFQDIYSVDTSGNGGIITMDVPVEEVVFFDMYDFKKMLCLQYIGDTEKEEREFRKMLQEYGIRNDVDVMLTPFYPDLKRQVEESWKRLFRHHENIKNGNTEDVKSVQVGLWKLKKEWFR